jgi:hypothetical protein
MDHLAAEILRLDFDLREFVRIVVSTEAWQRRAIPYDATTGEAFSFAAPSLRRQSAEQLWDSILTLVAHDPWAYERPTGEAFAAAVNLDLSRKNPGLDAAHAAFERYEDSQSPRKTRRLGALAAPTALAALAAAAAAPRRRSASKRSLLCWWLGPGMCPWQRGRQRGSSCARHGAHGAVAIRRRRGLLRLGRRLCGQRPSRHRLQRQHCSQLGHRPIRHGASK